MSEQASVTSIADRFDGRDVDERSRIIEVRPDATHIIATEAEDALLAAGAPFYVRSGGGGVVRPVVNEVAASRNRRTKVAALRPISADTLTDYLSRAAHWVKFSARQKGLVPTDPPPAVAKTILGREGEWRFPIVAGVITTPTLRPDGTILREPGYDEPTRLLLVDPPPMPVIPDKPSRADAVMALDLLDELLDEFPFIGDADRSVALSALISPVVRGALATVPAHVSKAPVAGSGKSYLWDVSSYISAGEAAPVLSAAIKEDETEKRLVSALISGQAIIALDNVNGPLGGDLLCQIIERPLVTPRPLGASILVKVENRACVFATGNNIQLLGDMTRRVIVCSLDPNVERPELREFKHKPHEMVLANRGKYVAAALTICRAYAVAGCPKPCRSLASFEDWSLTVRSALVWLGRADPVETMEAARADDPVTSSIRAVFGSWYAAVGDAWRSGAEIKRDATSTVFDSYSHPDLNQALRDVAEDRRGDISTVRLGIFLTKHKDRVVNGLKLVAEDDTHANVKLWKVVKS